MFELNPDLYALDLPDPGRYLLVSPLRGGRMEIDAALLSRLQTDPEMAARFFPGDTPAPPPPPEAPLDFNPMHRSGVVLSLTSGCNLRCTYCSVSGGDYHDTMPWPIIQAILDYVPGVARRNRGRYSLRFHGDGEPFVEQDLMFRVIHEFDVLAPRLHTKVTTNGTMIDEKNIQRVKTMINQIQVSCDGDPLTQDLQRPGPGGKPSSPMMDRCFTLLQRENITFGIRMTVTRQSAARAEDIAQYLLSIGAKNTRRLGVVIEPAGISGAGRCDDSMAPTAEEFSEAYRVIRAATADTNVQLKTSAEHLLAPEDQTSIFCGTPMAMMLVLPNGDVTSCSRSTVKSDPLYKDFVFGRFDPDAQGFTFDNEKVQALTGLNVHSYSECASCFVRWHCGGGCSNVRKTAGVPCDLIRGLSAEGIIREHLAAKLGVAVGE